MPAAVAHFTMVPPHTVLRLAVQPLHTLDDKRSSLNLEEYVYTAVRTMKETQQRRQDKEDLLQVRLSIFDICVEMYLFISI